MVASLLRLRPSISSPADHARVAGQADQGIIAASEIDRKGRVVAEARAREVRQRDTLKRLEEDVDVWVATAADSVPYLIPLSFLWDGGTVLVATPTDSPTSRSLTATGRVRLGFGATRDVIMMDGTAAGTPDTEIGAEVAAAFEAKTGFDPRRESAPYTYFRIRPERVQAWREANELSGRVLMRDGRWVSGPG
jgi:hypothetical protein